MGSELFDSVLTKKLQQIISNGLAKGKIDHLATELVEITSYLNTKKLQIPAVEKILPELVSPEELLQKGCSNMAKMRAANQNAKMEVSDDLLLSNLIKKLEKFKEDIADNKELLELGSRFKAILDIYKAALTRWRQAVAQQDEKTKKEMTTPKPRLMAASIQQVLQVASNEEARVFAGVDSFGFPHRTIAEGNNVVSRAGNRETGEEAFLKRNVEDGNHIAPGAEYQSFSTGEIVFKDVKIGAEVDFLVLEFMINPIDETKSDPNAIKVFELLRRNAKEVEKAEEFFEKIEKFSKERGEFSKKMGEFLKSKGETFWRNDPILMRTIVGASKGSLTVEEFCEKVEKFLEKARDVSKMMEEFLKNVEELFWEDNPLLMSSILEIKVTLIETSEAKFWENNPELAKKIGGDKQKVKLNLKAADPKSFWEDNPELAKKIPEKQRPNLQLGVRDAARFWQLNSSLCSKVNSQKLTALKATTEEEFWKSNPELIDSVAGKPKLDFTGKTAEEIWEKNKEGYFKGKIVRNPTKIRADIQAGEAIYGVSLKKTLKLMRLYKELQQAAGDKYLIEQVLPNVGTPSFLSEVFEYYYPRSEDNNERIKLFQLIPELFKAKTPQQINALLPNLFLYSHMTDTTWKNISAAVLDALTYPREDDHFDNSQWTGEEVVMIDRDRSRVRTIGRVGDLYHLVMKSGMLMLAQKDMPFHPEIVKRIVDNHPMLLMLELLKDLYWHNQRIERMRALGILKDEQLFKTSGGKKQKKREKKLDVLIEVDLEQMGREYRDRLITYTAFHSDPNISVQDLSFKLREVETLYYLTVLEQQKNDPLEALGYLYEKYDPNNPATNNDIATVLTKAGRYEQKLFCNGTKSAKELLQEIPEHNEKGVGIEAMIAKRTSTPEQAIQDRVKKFFSEPQELEIFWRVLGYIGKNFDFVSELPENLILRSTFPGQPDATLSLSELLYDAIYNKRADAVRLLSRCVKDINAFIEIEVNGYKIKIRPLHLAVWKDCADPDVLRALCEHPKINMHVTDTDNPNAGNTVLFCLDPLLPSAQFENIFRELIKKVDPDTRCKEKGIKPGLTFLEMIIEQEQPQVFTALTKYGAGKSLFTKPGVVLELVAKYSNHYPMQEGLKYLAQHNPEIAKAACLSIMTMPMVEPPIPNAVVLQDRTGSKRSVAFPVVPKIFQNDWSICPSIEGASGSVAKVNSAGWEAFFKTPSWSHFETYAFKALWKLIFPRIPGFVEDELFCITNTNQPLVFSPKVEGEDLANILNNEDPEMLKQFVHKLNPRNFAAWVLMEMLVGLGDNSDAARFVVRPSLGKDGETVYDLVLVGSKDVFQFSEKSDNALSSKSLIYCLGLMEKPLLREVVDAFAKLDIDKVLLSWLSGLQQSTDSLKKLFSNVVPPFAKILFPAGEISRIYRVAKKMQQWAQANPDAMPLYLMQEVSPSGAFYERLFAKYPGNEVVATRGRVETMQQASLVRAENRDFIDLIAAQSELQVTQTEISSLSGLQSEIESGKLEAFKKLLAPLLDKAKTNNLAERNIIAHKVQLLLQAIDFRTFSKDDLKSRKIDKDFLSKFFKLIVEAKLSLAILNIQYASIDRDVLILILQASASTLHELDLSGCPVELDAKLITAINGCKALRGFRANENGTKVIQGLELPNLLHLEMVGCVCVTKISDIKTPRLVTLQLMNASELMELGIEANNLSSADLTGCNKLSLQSIRKLVLQARNVIKELKGLPPKIMQESRMLMEFCTSHFPQVLPLKSAENFLATEEKLDMNGLPFFNEYAKRLMQLGAQDKFAKTVNIVGAPYLSSELVAQLFAENPGRLAIELTDTQEEKDFSEYKAPVTLSKTGYGVAAFDPKVGRIYIASKSKGGGISVWKFDASLQLIKQKEDFEINKDTVINQLCILSHGNIVVGDSAGEVRYFKDSGECYRTLKLFSQGIVSLTSSPRGLIAVSASGVVKVADVQTGADIATFNPLEGLGDQVTAVEVLLFDSEGRLPLAIVTRKGRLSIWTTTGECLVPSIQAHDVDSPINTVKLLSVDQGVVFATGAADSSIKTWRMDGETVELVKDMQDPHVDPVNAMLPLGFGIVATADAGNNVKILDIVTGDILFELPSYKNNLQSITRLAIYQGNLLVFTPGDGGVRVFKLPTASYRLSEFASLQDGEISLVGQNAIKLYTSLGRDQLCRFVKFVMNIVGAAGNEGLGGIKPIINSENGGRSFNVTFNVACREKFQSLGALLQAAVTPTQEMVAIRGRADSTFFGVSQDSPPKAGSILNGLSDSPPIAGGVLGRYSPPNNGSPGGSPRI